MTEPVTYREAKEKAEAKEKYMKVRVARVFVRSAANWNIRSSMLRVRRNRRRRTWFVWQRSEPSERQLWLNARSRPMVGYHLFAVGRLPI